MWLLAGSTKFQFPSCCIAGFASIQMFPCLCVGIVSDEQLSLYSEFSYRVVFSFNPFNSTGWGNKRPLPTPANVPQVSFLHWPRPPCLQEGSQSLRWEVFHSVFLCYIINTNHRSKRGKCPTSQRAPDLWHTGQEKRSRAGQQDPRYAGGQKRARGVPQVNLILLVY